MENVEGTCSPSSDDETWCVVVCNIFDELDTDISLDTFNTVQLTIWFDELSKIDRIHDNFTKKCYYKKSNAK